MNKIIKKTISINLGMVFLYINKKISLLIDIFFHTTNIDIKFISNKFFKCYYENCFIC